MMPFYSFHPMVSRIPPITIHLEGDMLWDGPILQSSYEHLTKLVHCPFPQWRVEYQLPYESYNIGHDDKKKSKIVGDDVGFHLRDFEVRQARYRNPLEERMLFDGMQDQAAYSPDSRDAGSQAIS